MFKKAMMTAAVAAALGVPGLTPVQQAAAAEASEHTLTGNVGIYSQYIFRGLTQTDRKPALQGGFDYSHSSGFYVGTWASNVSWLRDGSPVSAYSAGGSLEWDFYGGYKWEFAKDWVLDVGTLYYWYPGTANPVPIVAGVGNPKADTWEIYAALNWKWLSAKYSYGLKNETFAVKDSSGTWYIDLTANMPLGEWIGVNGLNFVAHWGWQKYSGTDPRNWTVGGLPLSNDEIYSYKDWKVGFTYTLPKDFTIGVMYTDTSGSNVLGYGSVTDCNAIGCGAYPRNLGNGTVTAYIQKTF